MPLRRASSSLRLLPDSGRTAREFLRSQVSGALQVTRGAGGWSRLTSATAIELGTAQNTPRFSWSAALGRMALLLEPSRTNRLTHANFVDTGPDNVPDNWVELVALSAGARMFVDAAAGLHGGAALRFTNGGAGDGCYQAITLDGSSTYATSVWVKTTGLSAGEKVSVASDGGIAYLYIAVPSGTNDWTRVTANLADTVAADFGVLANESAMTGTILLALPQVELGVYATSAIPSSGGAATRAAELCAIDPDVVPADNGRIRLIWIPEWSSTASAAVASFLTIGAADRVEYNGANDTIRVINNGSARATSAALSFAKDTAHVIDFAYSSSFGTRLAVDGVVVVDSTPWVPPTVAPYLGSRAASANLEGAGYADLEVWDLAA